MEWGWAAAVGTLLVGQLALIGVEWARHWIERDQRRRDARDDLQRRTLQDLQEALFLHFRALRNSLAEYKQTSQGLPAPEWPEAENPRILGAGLWARITILKERVVDPEARGLVESFITVSDNLTSGPYAPDATSVDEFEERLERLREAHDAANKRIGELLRSL